MIPAGNLHRGGFGSPMSSVGLQKEPQFQIVAALPDGMKAVQIAKELN